MQRRELKSQLGWKQLRLVLVTLLSVLISDAGTAEAKSLSKLSKQSQEILEQAFRASASAPEADAIAKKLLKRPRAQIVQAIKEGLKSRAEWQIVAARLAVLANEKSVATDLREAAKETPDWQLLSALKHLSNDSEQSENDALVISSINRWPAATRVAGLSLLESSKAKVSEQTFDQWIKDPSFEVRQAATRQFIATRSLYTDAEKIQRLKKLFVAKPYQVRLEAMESYAAFPVSERSKLNGVVKKDLCSSEMNTEVKAACESLVRGGS